MGAMRIARGSKASKRSAAGIRWAALGVVPCLLLIFPLFASPAQASSSETQESAINDVECASANTVIHGDMTTNSDGGPSDKTWSIIVTFGLDGGDNNQYARFYFDVIDNNLTKGVGFFGTSELNWVNHDTASRGTITAEIGTTFTLYYDVDNEDSNSQCFYLNAYPGYW
jgi:hypothetical protein